MFSYPYAGLLRFLYVLVLSSRNIGANQDAVKSSLAVIQQIGFRDVPGSGSMFVRLV